MKAILKFFFKETIESIRNEAINTAVKMEKDRVSEKKEKNSDFLFNYKNKIGRFIIAVPNEYDDIIFGVITRHDILGKTKVAYVYDYLRKEEIILMQKALPYKEKFAEEMSNLTPYSRHILIYGYEKTFSYENKNTIIGWNKTKKLLTENGFFDALKEYES